MDGLRLHHIGVAVRDIAQAVPFYRDVMGFDRADGPYDDPVQKVSVLFLTSTAGVGPCIELIAPLSESSPINRYLAKECGAYHLCYEVDALERTLEELRGKGCMVISGPVPAVGFQQRRIAWLFTPTRQLIELVESRRQAAENSQA